MLSGDAMRNFSVHEGSAAQARDTAALIAFVVDESRTMRSAHRWLKDAVLHLERNLLQRDVGRKRWNLYALVGFGHHNRNSLFQDQGNIVQVGGSGSHCGSALQFRGAVNRLRVDGEGSDSFSAISAALHGVSCLRKRRPLNTACQIVLVTDRPRRTLSSWNNQSIAEELQRENCVLNVVVKKRLQGRHGPRNQWRRVLGITDNGEKAFLAQARNRYVELPEGRPLPGRGHRQADYVRLATAVDGSAWDVTMLYREGYRQALTKAFVETLATHAERQSKSRCDDCSCENGVLNCGHVRGVNSERFCINPLGKVLLSTLDST